MQNRKPDNKQPNVSMSEHDKQKTVSNPSPGSSDPGNEHSRTTSGRDTSSRNSRKTS